MSDSAISTGPRLVKRRRRPPLACEQCRKRKIRCDRNVPCNHCTKSNIESCTYAPAHVPKLRRRQRSDLSDKAVFRTHPPAHIRPSASGSLVDTSDSENLSRSGILQQLAGAAQIKPTTDLVSPPSDRESLLERISQLERKLANVHHGQHDPHAGDSALLNSSPQLPAAKGSISKTRYFGQSHWMNGASLFPVVMALFGREEREKGGLYQCLAKCKVLGRKIKASRLRPLSSLDLCNNVPSRQVADALVEAYLRTFEGVLRIVHVPTFRAEYERYWRNPSAANEAFVIMLQLCMALGTVLHEDPVSMKSMAIGWIYEAQLWLMLPPEKSRMTLAGIQIMCLLTLAKSVCGVGQDLTWVTAGSLVRNAMYMGLHRDPKHLAEMTTYRAEMRRRLWATILELNLQYSFEAGGLPLISPNDYDTLPPSNLNDDQLTDKPDGTCTPTPDRPTQALIQIQLLKSVPLRLQLLQHVNDFRTGESYEKTLRLSNELTKACRDFSRVVSEAAKSNANGIPTSIAPFHMSLSEVFLYRCFQTLHIPILCASFEDPRYYFSRKMCLDSALKLTDLWGFSKPRGSTSMTDFRRAITNGCGIFRNVPVQSIFVLSIELMQEKMGNITGLGYLPAVGEADIYSYLQEALEWTFDRVRAGEVTAKGSCFLAGCMACLAHAEALEKGLGQKDAEALLLQKATESANKSWDELKTMARRLDIATGEEDDRSANTDTQNSVGELVADWDNGWAWDEADGLVWGGPWTQLQMPLDDDLNKFFGSYT